MKPKVDASALTPADVVSRAKKRIFGKMVTRAGS